MSSASFTELQMTSSEMLVYGEHSIAENLKPETDLKIIINYANCSEMDFWQPFTQHV